MFSESSPLLAWAAWQLQDSPTACGTLRYLFTKPLEQVAAPPGTYYIVQLSIIIECSTIFGSILDKMALKGILYSESGWYF